MISWMSLLVLVLWKQDLVGGIRVVDLRIPAHAAEGGTALLGCHFDMEGDELYSVKWYKDDREFYRYVPNNREPTKVFITPGITVDISRSSSTVVALTNLKEESAGTYRCEVSGEAPKFTTVYDEKYITIHFLPKSGLKILGLKKQYNFGEEAVLNCSSPGSRPETQLKWVINDKPVPKQHLRGPWIRILPERQNIMETFLELSFTVMPMHFKNGVLSIKCQAVIAPLYQEEVIHQIFLDDNIYSTMASPIGLKQENLYFQSPIYNEVKDLGFPPLPEYSSEEATDNVAKFQPKVSNAQYLLFLVLLIKLIL